jgi:hypothetical protein
MQQRKCRHTLTILLASENYKWKLRVRSSFVKSPIHSNPMMQPFCMHNGQEELGNLLL